MNLKNVRNIGISAHIDSGKTTLSERILFYAGRIHKIEDVRGGGDGATMDHMELEKERGITITSAATSLQWKNYDINLIDTPGHVDFTVEVERSLRVLDGAILVLCSVGGVQSQSMTVDRQMKRYHVPRLAFINKMDRTGANPFKVVQQVRKKLGADAVLMQLPIGSEENFKGVVDLVAMKAYFFDGEKGEVVRVDEIPADMKDDAEAARHEMLESLSMYSDDLMEKLLGEEEISEELIHDITRHAVIEQEFTPVFMGSAYKNKGVQPLLDAITRYLPSPTEVTNKGADPQDPDKVMKLEPDASKPLVAMGFKLTDDEFGQLTYTRIYQGKVKKGESYFNQRTGRKERFSRLVRMHSDKREEIDSASAGDIIAVMGIDCASGDTYCDQPNYCTLENIYVAEPVIKMSINPLSRDNSDKLSKALQRFRKEDPTFHVFTDEETNETVIAGMGELHLEIYVERIRREYGVDVEVGAPKVSYRESGQQPYEFDHTRKKQTGGSGQYGCIMGVMSPQTEEDREAVRETGSEPNELIFIDKVTGGRIPKNFIPAIEKGFRNMLDKGPVAGYPVVNMKIELVDGKYHDVDSSDMAFMLTSQECFREHFNKMKPVLLEPIMLMEIECPEEFQGQVVGQVSSKRGMIVETETNDGMTKIIAEVPLAETFGYSTDLRSNTQGQGTFSMEFAKYAPVPSSIQTEIVEERKKELQPA
ncbi:Elongation factor G [Posidoniimonas polymericola]|uniref:Elongation factor G n=1 Tax=Posidoniimonas polymericola TaxID=2528002 RepID=A0A5C5ZDJ5_9BACT|nr:elongation factor G [Posidoniimonas polymericola]TWT85235.1 Elongation factor G [Posidoniimonas polymericola]